MEVPFLKWAGGKRWLLQHPDFYVPAFSGRYFEPFLGGGSVLFRLKPASGVVSDLNRSLTETYIAIRDDYRSVEEHLRQHAAKHSDSYYYDVRASTYEDSAERAAQFIYLNRSCWNGLYRVNKRGEFNVPRGTKNNILLETDDFESASVILSRFEIRCSDFEAIFDMAGKGDLIFADPPYTVHHNNNGFIKYNEKIFSWDDQIRLRNAAFRASARGAIVLITNADHDSLKNLYSDISETKSIERASVISGKSSGRKVTTELIIRM